MRLDLRDVTICAVDSVNVELAARALNLSVAQCEFRDAILFSDAPVEGAFRAVEIDKIESTAAYSNFVFKRLPKLIETPFLLVVQWDGYVIDSGAWSPAFRDYDYIGAKWPGVTDGMSVGNGGFSLRSRKFMSALMADRFPLSSDANSDTIACRKYRPLLESDYDIRFAPESVADVFSYETTSPSEYGKPWPRTFGFHGMGNMWRHVEDSELVELIDRLSPYVYSTHHYAKLILSYFLLENFELMSALYARMKAHAGSDAARDALQIAGGGDEGARRCVERCVAACELVLRTNGRARRLAIQAVRAQRAAALRFAHALGKKSSFEL